MKTPVSPRRYSIFTSSDSRELSRVFLTFYVKFFALETSVRRFVMRWTGWSRLPADPPGETQHRPSCLLQSPNPVSSQLYPASRRHRSRVRSCKCDGGGALTTGKHRNSASAQMFIKYKLLSFSPFLFNRVYSRLMLLCVQYTGGDKTMLLL